MWLSVAVRKRKALLSEEERSIKEKFVLHNILKRKFFNSPTGMQDLVTLYEASKSKLTANDTFTQVSIL